jgi:hypothetical protein
MCLGAIFLNTKSLVLSSARFHKIHFNVFPKEIRNISYNLQNRSGIINSNGIKFSTASACFDHGLKFSESSLAQFSKSWNRNSSTNWNFQQRQRYSTFKSPSALDSAFPFIAVSISAVLLAFYGSMALSLYSDWKNGNETEKWSTTHGIIDSVHVESSPVGLSFAKSFFHKVKFSYVTPDGFVCFSKSLVNIFLV